MSDPATSSPPPARVLFHLGPLDVTTRRLVWTSLAVLALVGLSLVWSRLDLAALHARAATLPAPAVFAAITLLPLVGFPVAVLHLVAGVRFGLWGGLVVVAVTSVAHYVIAWLLVAILPEHLFAFLAPWRKKLSAVGHRDATLLCCLLPGLPYTPQLYLLPLLGTPLLLMFGLAAALHTARAVATILLGDFSDDLTPPRIAALVAYYVLLFALSAFALRGLRRTLAQ